MHPVLISFGNFSVSSFGFFLSAAFLLAVYVIWRLCRVYDINEEKILDISLLTFFGGVLGARIYYILTNLYLFSGFSQMVEVWRFPGLSFWGGLIGGGVALYFLTRRFKMDFWHIADFVTVGLFVGLVLGTFGCLLGSCESGSVSGLPIAVTQIGLVGKRFPIQFFESLFFLLVFLRLWRVCLRFHYNGRVLSAGLIALGVIKFLADFFRSNTEVSAGPINAGRFFAVAAIAAGFYVKFRQTKHSLKADLQLVFSSRFRKTVVPKYLRAWYNLSTNMHLRLIRSWKNVRSQARSVLKNLNVKSQPPKY